MCACTEPVRTGIGAVCVEYGRSKWPITMLNHTHNHTNTQTHIPGTKECFVFYFWHPMLVRPVMKRPFFSLENQGKKGSLRSRASLLIHKLSLYYPVQECSLCISTRTLTAVQSSVLYCTYNARYRYDICCCKNTQCLYYCCCFAATAADAGDGAWYCCCRYPLVLLLLVLRLLLCIADLLLK